MTGLQPAALCMFTRARVWRGSPAPRNGSYRGSPHVSVPIPHVFVQDP